MKLKVVSIFILIGFVASAVTPANKYIKNSEDALLEVYFSRKAITDTTMRDKRFFLDDVILRIGKNKSMFCGIKNLFVDSLSTVDYSTYYMLLINHYDKNKSSSNLLSGHYWSYIYKDFQDNTCKEYEYFDMEHWKYSEDLKTPEWVVTDSVKKIIGYECFKATTSFKGRQWIAWFAPEIPVSDGPWKLHSLPGLILEAYDRSHDYEFEAKGIRSSGLGMVGYMEYKDYIELSREKYMKNWCEYKHSNFSAKIRATMGLQSNKPVSFKRIPKYDREEINYDHSLK